MPLDKKRKPHQLRPPDRIELDEPCFEMRASGELFADYEEYVDALMSYQARTWSCALTGKGKLTFEEAQLSERQAQRKVDEAFPEMYVEPLCRMAHMSQVRMDELIERAFVRLQGFVADEEVQVVRRVADGAAPAGFRWAEQRTARIVQAIGVDEDYWADLDHPVP
eukprot:CAMPEP_0180392752 /NCGR_PEP_ID=MMETSP0989-20121125/33337_1 /TAXON_ID=697907 /ORGANISM="non described non described, Strain CCMP2293" /LENGTH=165 /DNA_ID=CAMNT_0022394497 /DNA_START=265 /DNA_END=758 /DNA_ORIENTATION=+